MDLVITPEPSEDERAAIVAALVVPVQPPSPWRAEDDDEDEDAAP